MLEGIVIYFTEVLDFAHIVQLAIISVSCVAVLSHPKKKFTAVAAAAGMACGVFAVCMVLEMLFFAISKVTRAFAGICFPLAYMITVVLYSVLFCRFSPKFRIIMSGVLFSSGILVTELIKQFAFLMPVKGDAAVSAVVILLNMLNFVTAFVLIRFSIVRYEDISVSGMALIVLSNSVIVIAVLIYEILMMHVFTGDLVANQTYTSVSALFLYVIEIAAYLMVYFICKGDREIVTLHAENKMMETDRELIRITEKSLSDMRQVSHDVKNQYAYIALLLEGGRYDDLKKYVAEMGGNILKPLSYIDCGNKTVNTIMNVEKAKAESRGLKFSYSINVPPVLPFRDTSLCSLISNLVDNAIEACERNGLTDAEISTTISIRQEYFYIGVVNPLPEGIDTAELLSLNTHKKDRTVHGLGTKIIKRIAAGYNGYVMYSVENSHFIAEVMLDIMWEGKR